MKITLQKSRLPTGDHGDLLEAVYHNYSCSGAEGDVCLYSGVALS